MCETWGEVAIETEAFFFLPLQSPVGQISVFVIGPGGELLQNVGRQPDRRVVDPTA